METLKAIQSRNSVAHLTEPAPTIEEMEEVYKGALRAPDHAWLRPWKYIEIRGDSRKKLRGTEREKERVRDNGRERESEQDREMGKSSQK